MQNTSKIKSINVDLTLSNFRAEIERRGITQVQAAKEAGVSPATLTQLLNGTYGAKPQKQVEKLAKWLTAAEESLSQPQMRAAPEWVETPTSTRILAALGYVQTFGDMTVIYGGAGLGKTTACKEYRRRFPNVWLSTMTPATASVASSLEKVCLSLGMKAPPKSAARMEREIVGRVESTNGLLIIDEAQHLTVQALDNLRALYDETGIGIALVGNEAVYTSMTGGNRAAYLDRLFSRIGKRVKLTRATKKDVIALAVALGVDPSNKESIDFLTNIGNRAGALRSVVKTLRLASMFAGGEEPVFADIKAAWGDLNA